MKTKKTFGIIGGDLRQYYLAESLIKDGCKVITFGFDKLTKAENTFKKLSLHEVIDLSDYIIFPVPITRDGTTLNAPFSGSKIYIEKQLLNLAKSKKIFGGIIIPPIEKHVKKRNILFYDYYSEDLIMENASLTAEGAIKVFLENSLKSINKAKCLVVGYGRIGKILCKLLKKFGAEITATARKSKDKLLIIGNNYNFTYTSKIIDDQDLQSYDVIFNTVPATIFDENILAKLSPDTIIVDLASEPGGVDKNSAKKLGIKFFHELGIPGKYFPKSSGEIIKKKIYQIIKEENI